MKKTTKKISAAALALIMGATAFTGCSGSTNSTQDNSQYQPVSQSVYGLLGKYEFHTRRNGQRRINKRRSSYRQSEDNVF